MSEYQNVITFTLHHLHPRLTNWGRWSSERHKPGHCGSAEWRYRRSSDEPDQGAAVPSLGEIDIWDAVKIEKVVTRLPHAHRTAIIGWYSARDSVVYITNRVGIPYSGFDEFMRRSLCMVENKLIRRG